MRETPAHGCRVCRSYGAASAVSAAIICHARSAQALAQVPGAYTRCSWSLHHWLSSSSFPPPKSCWPHCPRRSSMLWTLPCPFDGPLPPAKPGFPAVGHAIASWRPRRWLPAGPPGPLRSTSGGPGLGDRADDAADDEFAGLNGQNLSAKRRSNASGGVVRLLRWLEPGHQTAGCGSTPLTSNCCLWK